MITRPLDLASRLRPEPRGFDAWFYVNAALLALFFALFGSRFVLAPGLGLDFQLPRLAGARAGASLTTCEIHVLRSGQIVTEDGLVDMGQFRAWLKVQAARNREPTLLILASADLSLSELADIQDAAHTAGFRIVLGAEEASLRTTGGGG